MQKFPCLKQTIGVIKIGKIARWKGDCVSAVSREEAPEEEGRQ